MRRKNEDDPATTGKQRSVRIDANLLKAVGTFGQSIWLDYIRRELIAGGQLRQLIEEDGLLGYTARIIPDCFRVAVPQEAETILWQR